MLTQRRLCSKYSTKKTFYAFNFSLPRLTTPFLSILTKETFPNAQLPLFPIFKLMNLFWFLVMCVEYTIHLFYLKQSMLVSTLPCSNFPFFSHVVVGFSFFMIGAYSFISLKLYALCPRLFHL